MSHNALISKVDSPEAGRALENLLASKFGAGWIVMDLYAYRATDRSVRYYRARLIRRGVHHRPGAKPCFQSLRQEGLRWCLGEPPLPPRGRLLFNLHLLHGGDVARWVYLTQGESSANALQRLELLATTCGEAVPASTADWRPLRGRRVRIWPDAGRAGQVFAGDLLPRLRQQGCTIELLEADTLGLAEGQTPQDWCELYPQAQAAEVEALSWQCWPPPLSVPAAAFSLTQPAAAQSQR